MHRRVSKTPDPLNEAAQQRAMGCLELARRLAVQAFNRCGRTVPLAELAGEARLALVHAAAFYDESREVPFGAFVTLVVRRRLIQAVTEWRRGGRLAHVPFTDLAGRDPSQDAPSFDPPCLRTFAPGREVAACEVLERVRRSMPKRWFLALWLYYVDGHTLEEVGTRLGVCRERVRQLLCKGLRRARRRHPGERGSW